MTRILGFLMLAAALGSLLAVFLDRRAVQSEVSMERAADATSESRFERVVASMWWHQERFEKALSLSQEQVAQMDELCLESLRRRLRLRQSVQEDSEAYRQALGQGLLGEAAALIEGLAVQSAELQVIEERMTLTVLGLLDEQQMAQIREHASVLLELPWLKTLGSTPGGRPRGRGEAGRGGAGSSGAGSVSGAGDASGNARSRPAS